MATTARGIVYPTVGTTLTPLSNHFASLATSTNTALDNLANTSARMIGTDAARTALTAPSLKEGLSWYSTDTNREWLYDGSNWISVENGMYIVRPTSVVGGVINSDGSITPSGGATSLSLNGIFSTRFRRYRIDFNLRIVSAATFTLRLRNAGVDDSSANYGGQFHYASAASPGSVSNAGATLWGNFGPSTTSDRFFGELTFIAPGLSGSGENFMKSAYGNVSGVFNQQVVNFSNFLNNKKTNTFDGLTLTAGSAFVANTGTFRVYGMA